MALFAVLLAGSAAGIAALPAAGAAVCLRLGGCGERDLLEVDMKESRFLPHVLPRRTFVPVAFRSKVGISTSGGSHPSALREALLAVDKDVVVQTRGLPVCRGGGFHRNTRPANALRRAEAACGEAIVGRGRAGFSISFPDQEPVYVASRVVLFNVGVRKGAITFRAAAELEVPVPSLLVATVELRRKAPGWTVTVRTPGVAGGSGSLSYIALKVGRKFNYRGERRSLLSARCPDGRFKISTPKLVFRNEAEAPNVAARTVLKGVLSVPCKPKR